MWRHPVLSAHSASRFLRRPFALDEAVWPGDLGGTAPRLFPFGAHLLPRHAGDSVQAQSRRHAARQHQAERPGIHVPTESRHRWQPLVEGRLGIPEAMRGASDASVARFYGPTGPIVPTDGWAVIGRFRPLASHLVKTVALAVAQVAPLLYKTPGIVMGAALALVVDNVAVSEQRAVKLIERGHLVERQIVDQDRRCVGRIVRAATQIDDLQAGDGLLQSHGARRIRVGSN